MSVLLVNFTFTGLLRVEMYFPSHSTESIGTFFAVSFLSSSVFPVETLAMAEMTLVLVS